MTWLWSMQGAVTISFLINLINVRFSPITKIIVYYMKSNSFMFSNWTRKSWKTDDHNNEWKLYFNCEVSDWIDCTKDMFCTVIMFHVVKLHCLIVINLLIILRTCRHQSCKILSMVKLCFQPEFLYNNTHNRLTSAGINLIFFRLENFRNEIQSGHHSLNG